MSLYSSHINPPGVWTALSVPINHPVHALLDLGNNFIKIYFSLCDLVNNHVGNPDFLGNVPAQHARMRVICSHSFCFFILKFMSCLFYCLPFLGKKKM